jgi:hypothetical protein
VFVPVQTVRAINVQLHGHAEGCQRRSTRARRAKPKCQALYLHGSELFE